MLIKVIPHKFQTISSDDKDASFYLEQDNWNDYDYYTTYYLHLSAKHTKNNEPVHIGQVKILNLHQEKKEKFLVPIGRLDSLDESFCSIGQSLDYYQRLSECDDSLKHELLLALRDGIINPTFKQNFIQTEGWRDSIMRSLANDDDIFDLAPAIISGNFQVLPSLDLKFSFKIPAMEIPLEFDFDAPKYGPFEENSLPNRIAVIIGRNGSGKSTLMSKIAKIAFASTKDRNDPALLSIGEITPIGLGFPRVVTLSYSAFDSFHVPGVYKHEKEQIAKDIKNGAGRYIFCGIRDIVKEVEGLIPLLSLQENGKLASQHIMEDKHSNTLLKSISDLAQEFVDLIEKVKFLDRGDQLVGAFQILCEEPSVSQSTLNLLSYSPEEIRNFFMHLSTGHKFVFHSVVCVVVYTNPRSLFLFDEPETHLHPPLLAVLMKAIRNILTNYNSFMIVATHSPVVIQETLNKHVYIIRREGELITIEPPSIQTFGENIGMITSTIFGLSTDITDYHSELDNIVSSISWPQIQSPDNLMEEIENLFNSDLSMQARAYLISKIYKK